MKINKVVFLEKLKELYVATDKEPMLNSDCFVFDQNKIFASTIMFMAQTDFSYGGRCALKAKKLIDVLSSCPADIIQLDFQDSKLRIISGKFKSTINYVEFEADPQVINPTKLTEISDELINALKSCTTITLGTSNFLEDTSALIHITDKYIEASDTYQLLYYTMNTDTKNSIVSGKLLSPVLKFYLTHYQFTRSALIVKTDNDVLFSLSLSHAKYDPSVYDLLSQENSIDAQKLTNIDNMIAAINRASLFAAKADNTRNKIIRVQIVPNRFIFSGLNFESGSAMDFVKLPHKLKDAAFSTSPEYLINGLKENTHIKIKENYLVLFGKSKKRIISIQKES